MSLGKAEPFRTSGGKAARRKVELHLHYRTVRFHRPGHRIAEPAAIKQRGALSAPASGLKAKEWPTYLHVGTATLSRWENGSQSIGVQADDLMRLMYSVLLAETSGRAIPEHVYAQTGALFLPATG